SRRVLDVFDLRAGWPWRLPARAPTDPDVRALTHPVLQPTAWPSRKGPRGYPSEFRGQAAEPRCAPPVSRARVCRPALRFPPQGPPGRVPLLRRYYRSATTSCRPSRRTSLPSLGSFSTVISVLGCSGHIFPQFFEGARGVAENIVPRASAEFALRALHQAGGQLYSWWPIHGGRH